MKFHGKLTYVSELKSIKLPDAEGGLDYYVNVIIEGVGYVRYQLVCKLFHKEPAEHLAKHWKANSARFQYCGVFDVELTAGKKTDINGQAVYYQVNRLVSYSFVQPSDPNAYQPTK